jgi:hypothetical protein
MQLSLADAAIALGRSQRQIRYLIQTGGLAARKEGGRWVIDSADLPLSAGQRQAAGRVALRTLLTHQEPEERTRQASGKKKPASSERRARQKWLALEDGQEKSVREQLGEYSSSVLDQSASG